MSKSAQRESAEYWKKRLFRNSFTYRGERRWVAGWCIKVQWGGERRTLRLEAESRELAASEAASVYATLRRGGWTAVDASKVRDVGRESVPVTLRVGVRRYVSNLHPGFERELFAEIQHDGMREQIALGTEDPAQGLARGTTIQSEVQRLGWKSVHGAHSREVTVAVFWQENPMTCTYTTLLSVPEVDRRTSRTEPRPGTGWNVLVVEPDGPVRRAMLRGLATAEGLAAVRGCASPQEMPEEWTWDLALANRNLGPGALRLLERRQSVPHEGGAWILEHGLYADSDAIFASVSGVSRGYFLRRLPPAKLLEPLLKTFLEGPRRNHSDEERLVRRYFQNALEPVDAVAEPPGPSFSKRETQVLDLLGRGFSDKEIGNELGISVWTVHSHMKRIFGKYGVRTRTEAVVRHLQK
jgi:DNA-binding NarL/FixJ family response regulator